MDNNYALVQRPAAYSWEAMTVLMGAVQESDPVTVDFPRKVRILSAYPSIGYHSGGFVLPAPTLDDLLVRIEVDVGQERRLTTRFDAVLSNGRGSYPEVTLGSYRDTTGGARIMDLLLGSEGDRPQLQFTFSWKHSVAGGPYYRNVCVGMVLHCNFE